MESHKSFEQMLYIFAPRDEVNIYWNRLYSVDFFNKEV
jgi:hypothetical protein